MLKKYGGIKKCMHNYEEVQKVPHISIIKYPTVCKSMTYYEINVNMFTIVKNPEYGRQSISQQMRIVAPIPQENGPRIPKNPIFLKNGKNHPKRKNSKTSRDLPILAIYPSTRGL